MTFGEVVDKLMAEWRSAPGPTRAAALSDALRKQGEFAEARRILTDGIGRFPAFLPLRVVQARIALDQGDRPTLERALEAASALEPDHPALREMIELHWPERLSGAIPERLAFADESVVEEFGPNEVAAGETLVTESLAALYRRQGHLDEARRAYAELVARDPENAALIASHREVQEELLAARPLPLDSRESGGTPVRAWLQAVALRRPEGGHGSEAPSSFDAFFEPPPAPPAATTDFDSFQRWLKELG